MSEKILITGAAGFIGSHLAERLVNEGKSVVGVDNFNDFYSPEQKRKNIEGLIKHPNFRLAEADLAKMDYDEHFKDVNIILHLAAQAGVRSSWGKDFFNYVNRNILVTQRLLEYFKDKQVRKFVYASSSSIYGDAAAMPTKEDTIPAPVSPYGVSKLAGEHLSMLYHKNFGIPVIVLRFFTVFGPRQRPDMGFNKFFHAILSGQEIKVFGDGRQTRDFTYVGDIVNALISSINSDISGEVFNIGGGHRVELNEVFDLFEELTHKKLNKKHITCARGDVRHTSADITRAEKMLNYKPQTSLKDGLLNEFNWIR